MSLLYVIVMELGMLQCRCQSLSPLRLIRKPFNRTAKSKDTSEAVSATSVNLRRMNSGAHTCNCKIIRPLYPLRSLPRLV